MKQTQEVDKIENQLVIEGWKEILVLSWSKILLTLPLDQETTKLSKHISVIQDICEIYFIHRFNRMNDDQFDLPCMNPPAPEPAVAAAPPACPTGSEPGRPYYAKLLQHLQLHQNQMGSQERK